MDSASTALLFYGCAVLSCAGRFIWIGDLGGDDHPIIDSLGASVVFFAGAGTVLHVIGRTKLPHLGFSAGDLSPGSEAPPQR